MRNEVALTPSNDARGNTTRLTKPMLGLAVGGTLGLLDGVSGFLEPSLAAVITSVITFSLLKGVIAGIVIGYVSQKSTFHRARNACVNGYCSSSEFAGALEGGNGFVLGHHAARDAAGSDCWISNAKIRKFDGRDGWDALKLTRKV